MRLLPNSEKYGAVSDFKCNYLCDKDKTKICGSENYNSVWDVSGYSGYLVNLPLCRRNISRPKDCRAYGGYNPRDLCMQTCRSDTRMTPEDECAISCLDYRTSYTDLNEEGR